MIETLTNLKAGKGKTLGTDGSAAERMKKFLNGLGKKRRGRPACGPAHYSPHHRASADITVRPHHRRLSWQVVACRCRLGWQPSCRA